MSSLCPYGVWSYGGLVWDKPSKEQKHWVTKCHLEIFLNVVFMIHCVMSSFFYYYYYRYCSWCDDTWSALFFQWSKTLSWESSSSLRKHFPWFHGPTDSCLSHGYFYINLPPIFMCLLPVVFMYLSKKKKNAVLLLAVLSDKEHMTTQSESRSTYMLLLERELLIYVSLFQSD